MNETSWQKNVLGFILVAAFAVTASPTLAQSDFLLQRPDGSSHLLPPTPRISLESSASSAELRLGTNERSAFSDPHWLLNAAEPGEGSSATPRPQEPRADYTPITGGGRVRWALKNTFGYRTLALGAAWSAVQTARNDPEEWGPGWEGFGKRYGSLEATQLMGSSIEAGLGAIWGEDPRYFHSSRRGFWPRVGYALKMTFFSYRRDGSTNFSYARATGITASRFISSTWYPPSSNDVQDTTARIGIGYLGHFLNNLWYEFTPEKWHGHK